VVLLISDERKNQLGFCYWNEWRPVFIQVYFLFISWNYIIKRHYFRLQVENLPVDMSFSINLIISGHNTENLPVDVSEDQVSIIVEFRIPIHIYKCIWCLQQSIYLGRMNSWTKLNPFKNNKYYTAIHHRFTLHSPTVVSCSPNIVVLLISDERKNQLGFCYWNEWRPVHIYKCIWCLQQSIYLGRMNSWRSSLCSFTVLCFGKLMHTALWY
jgi:hypothetical protein